MEREGRNTNRQRDSSLNSSISSQDLRYPRDFFNELVELSGSYGLEEDIATGFETPYFDPSRPQVFFNAGAPRGQPSGRLNHKLELPQLDQPVPTGDDFDTMVGQAISSDAFRRPMGHSGQQRDHLENIPQSWPQAGKPTTADILDPDVPLSWPLAGKQKPTTAPVFKEPESPALRVRKSGAAASESVGVGPEPSQDPTSTQPHVTAPVPDEPQVTAPAVPGCSYQRDTVPDRSNNPFLAAVLGNRPVYKPRPFPRTVGTESDDSSPEEVAHPKPKRVLGTLISYLMLKSSLPSVSLALMENQVNLPSSD